jgi:hypothetical protein
MTTQKWNAAFFVLAILPAISEPAFGTTIGPLPYKSIADSPFNLSRLGVDFYLDDFSQGIGSATKGPPSSGNLWSTLLMSPGVAITSYGPVFVIDLNQNPELFSPADYVRYPSQVRPVNVEFSFDASALGKLPQAVGFLINNNAPITADFYSADGDVVNQLAAPPAAPSVAVSGGGLDGAIYQSFRQRFVGATYALGISRISISSPGGTMILDDFQYGQLTPEAASLLMAICGLLGVAALCSRVRRVTNKGSSGHTPVADCFVLPPSPFPLPPSAFPPRNKPSRPQRILAPTAAGEA